MKKQNKVILSVASLLATMGVSLFSAACGSYKMNDFIVDGTTIDLEYYVGETVDFSGLKMYAAFTDDSREEIPLDKVKIYLWTSDTQQEEITNNLSKLTETAGKKVILIKYSSDYTERFEITVYANGGGNVDETAKLQSVTLAYGSVALEYEVGDAISLNGLTITATYDKGDPVNVPLDSEDVKIYMGEEDITGNLSKLTETAGTKIVRVAYKTVRSTNFLTITVTNPIVAISVDTTKLETNYEVGETVDFSKLKVSASHKDGSTQEVMLENVQYYVGETVLTDFSVLTETVGTKTVTVKYEGFSATFDVVVSNYVAAISLNTESVSLEFNAGAEVSFADFSNIVINVTYADETDTTVQKALTLASEGVVCSFNNETFTQEDWAGLTAFAGSKVITVTYGGKSATFTVMVAGESDIENLEVTAPTKTVYTAGESVSMDGLAITATYKEGFEDLNGTIAFADFAENEVKVYLGTKEVTDYNTITQVSQMGESNVVLTISYKGQTGEFIIQVNNPATAIVLDTTSVTTEYDFGDTVSVKNLKITATPTYGEEQTVDVSAVKFYEGETEITDLNTLTKTLGEKTVKVVYGLAYATFTVTVNDVLQNIAVSGTTAFECDVFATNLTFDGLVVTANYKSGATKDVTASATIDYANAVQGLGEKDVNVTYEGKTAQIKLTVRNVLKSLTISGSPEKLAFSSIVNFTGIVATGTYAYGEPQIIKLLQEDGTHFLYSVKFYVFEDVWTDVTNNLNDISTKSGVRKVMVEYDNGRQKVSGEFTVTVAEAMPTVDGYQLPTAMVQYNTSVANTTNDVNSANFEGTFFKNDVQDYLVGDDNAFKFLPILDQLLYYDEETDEWQGGTLASFKAQSTIYIKIDGEYVEMTKTQDATDKNIYRYSYNEVNYVTEYSHKNEYKFAEDGRAIGYNFKISVMPDPEVFDYEASIDMQPVECEIKITDGFNITDSKQLCVLEQSTRTDWNKIKAALGLTDVRPNAIVLHQDTMITKDSIPESFYYTLPDTYNVKYKYTNAEGQTVVCAPEEVPASMGGPLSRSYIWNTYDGEWGIFEYWMNEGETFEIHGNFFNLDASGLPLVASFEPNGVTPPTDADTYYGWDFSNVSILEVRGVDATKEAADESFAFDSLAVKGNSAIYQLLTDGSTTSNVTCADKPVYGGGLIFLKVKDVKANVDNVRAHTCFISFFSRDDTVVNYTRAKAYDGFQNAMYIHSDTINTLDNCHMKRAGGPLIIMNEDTDEDTKELMIPYVYIHENCEMESWVTGGEQWFATVGASSEVQSLMLTDALLRNYFQKTFTRASDGKVNMVAVTLNTDGMAGATDIYTQNYIEYSTSKLDRLETSAIRTQMLMYMGALVQAGSKAPITFSVGDNICALAPASNGLVTFSGGGLAYLQDDKANVATQQLFGEFTSNKYDHLAINMGGIGILVGYFNM